MLKIKLELFVILLQLSALGFSDDASSCVDNYLHFEEQTFDNNSENRLKLYQAFYPPNDHLPYSVVVTYQAVLSNGTRINIFTDSACPESQVWLWVSSPVLFIMDPVELNRLALYTLNHFTEWVPPHLTIVTPPPCPAKTEEFLPLMTTSLQAYALSKMSKEEHMGYSHQGCNTSIPIVSLKAENSGVHIYRTIGVIGFIFLAILNVMASIVLLQARLKALSLKMDAYNYSFDYYGMFWGISVTLCPALMVLLFEDIKHLYHITFNPDVWQSEYVRYMWPFVFAFPILFCTPVAIFFGVKLNLPIPSIYLLPAKLLCCCSEKGARVLVLSLTIWFNLVAANVIVGHGIFVLVAFPVAPFVVAVNVMLLVVTFMCLTYAMALVFTICASVATQNCLRSNSDCLRTIRAAMLIPLLLAIISFSMVVAFSSQFVNTATQQKGFPMLLKSLFAPVLLVAVSVSLKRFISVWLKWTLDRVKDGNAVNPLNEHVYNRYQAIDN